MAKPNFLHMLFGQQAANALGQAGMEEAPAANEIVVAANRPTTETPADPYDDFFVGNRSAVEEVNRANRVSQEASDRRGLFGTRGTVRDILGVLGDAFLVQSGNKAVYMPQREKEKIADAMAGFTKDPITASERTAGIDPDTGFGIYTKARELDMAGTNAKTRASELDYQRLKQGRTEASQAIAGALAAGTPEALAYAEQLATNAARAYGTTPEALGFRPGMTPDQARVFAGRSATTNQNLNLPLAERRASVAEGNLEVARGRLGVSRQQAANAARALNIRENTQEWNELMDMFGLGFEERRIQSTERNSRRGRNRGTGTSATTTTRPSVSNW